MTKGSKSRGSKSKDRDFEGTKTRSFGASQRINHDSSGYYSSRMNVGLAATRNGQVMPDNEFPTSLVNQIILGSSEAMMNVPDNSLHLMITSPPYNATKDYDTDLSLDEYLEVLKRVFAETYRTLVHGGRACINVANLGRKPYIPLSDHISLMMQEIGFLMRGEIIWNKGAGAGRSMAWGSWQSAANPVLRDVHEYILVFSKGDFKRERNGRENTIARDQFMEWTKSVWTMNPESAKKIGHPAPFPIELPYRLIQLYSYKDDIILDPFMGSGTTAIAALRSERKYFGYETDDDYLKISEDRLQAEVLPKSNET